MFNVSGPELLIVLVVALLVLGPDKLPEAARKVGRIAGELRRISNGFQAEVRTAMQEPIKATQETLDLARGRHDAMAATTPSGPYQATDPEVPSAAQGEAHLHELAEGASAHAQPDPADAPADADADAEGSGTSATGIPAAPAHDATEARPESGAADHPVA